MIESIPPRASGPHPTPDEIYRARQAPDDPASQPLLRHAAGCALCSSEMARQEAFDQPEPLAAADLDEAWQRFRRGEQPTPATPLVPGREARRNPRQDGRRPARWTPALALAATLTFCVLGLGSWLLQRPPQGAVEVERGGGREPAVFAESTSVLLKEPPALFTFAAPGDEPRRVKVFDAAQTYQWTSAPTLTGKVALPPAEQARLKPGVEYFWTVVGGTGEETAARSFRIERR